MYSYFLIVKELIRQKRKEVSTPNTQPRKYAKYASCSTLLVPPPEISSPPAASGDILQTSTFGTQRFRHTHVQTSRKHESDMDHNV